MKTPEGKVKDKVKEALRRAGAYYFMPVQTGYGSAGLDFHCCLGGMAFFVETKAPGKKPTQRQEATIAAIRIAGGAVFVVDGDESLKALAEFMTKLNGGGTRGSHSSKQ